MITLRSSLIDWLFSIENPLFWLLVGWLVNRYESSQRYVRIAVKKDKYFCKVVHECAFGQLWTNVALILGLTSSFPSYHLISKLQSHVICLSSPWSCILSIFNKPIPYHGLFLFFGCSNLNWASRTIGVTRTSASAMNVLLPLTLKVFISLVGVMFLSQKQHTISFNVLQESRDCQWLSNTTTQLSQKCLQLWTDDWLLTVEMMFVKFEGIKFDDSRLFKFEQKILCYYLSDERVLKFNFRNYYDSLFNKNY